MPQFVQLPSMPRMDLSSGVVPVTVVPAAREEGPSPLMSALIQGLGSAASQGIGALFQGMAQDKSFQNQKYLEKMRQDTDVRGQDINARYYNAVNKYNQDKLSYDKSKDQSEAEHTQITDLGKAYSSVGQAYERMAQLETDPVKRSQLLQEAARHHNMSEGLMADIAQGKHDTVANAQQAVPADGDIMDLINRGMTVSRADQKAGISAPSQDVAENAVLQQLQRSGNPANMPLDPLDMIGASRGSTGGFVPNENSGRGGPISPPGAGIQPHGNLAQDFQNMGIDALFGLAKAGGRLGAEVSQWKHIPGLPNIPIIPGITDFMPDVFSTPPAQFGESYYPNPGFMRARSQLENNAKSDSAVEKTAAGKSKYTPDIPFISDLQRILGYKPNDIEDLMNYYYGYNDSGL